MISTPFPADMADNDLEKSYRETTYTIHNSGIYINIGQLNEELDHIMEEYKAASWAFITAWNPGGNKLTLEENLKRQIKLLLEFKVDISMKGQGCARVHSWEEESYLIINISREDAHNISKKYGQLAYLYGEKDQKAALIFI